MNQDLSTKTFRELINLYTACSKLLDNNMGLDNDDYKTGFRIWSNLRWEFARRECRLYHLNSNSKEYHELTSFYTRPCFIKRSKCYCSHND